MATFTLFPSKKFLSIPFKIQLLETSPQKQKEQRQNQPDVSFFWCLFPSCTFWILCNLLLLFTFCQVCLLVKETAEIETGMAEKYSSDQANIWQKLGLFWRNRRLFAILSKTTFTYHSSSYLFFVSNILKIFPWQVCSQIVDDTNWLPFYLLCTQ